MKSITTILKMLIIGFALDAIGSCQRIHGCTDPYAYNYNPDAQVSNGSCQYGVTFYFDQNGANASVNIANQSGNVTANFQNGAPNCGAQGCANFYLPVGAYPYTAQSATTSWSGTLNVTAGCNVVLLAQSTGSVVFWTASNTFGTITVNINNGSGTISSYVTGGVPSCGFTGCATFDLQPGVYAYTATSQSGASWNGSVNVSGDACQPVQLN